MIAFWDSVLEPLLEAVSPRVVVEVGVARGATTTKLLEFASTRDCTVHAIDPAPNDALELDSMQERYGDRFVFHRRLSLEVLPRIEDVDAALLDGDHNWYTVYHELGALAERSAAAGRTFPLTMLHDVDWPYGRRDGYYDPGTIPAEFRHPHRRAGIIPGRNELSEAGGVNAAIDNAEVANTPRNGVRTAVEDFLADAPEAVTFRSVTGFNGLGIIASSAQLEGNAQLRRRLEELESPAWLSEHCRRLEEGRLALQSRLAPLRRAQRASAGSGGRPGR